MRIVPMTFALALAASAGAASCAKPAAEPPARSAAPSDVPAAKAGGCRNVFLYAANEDATQVVIIDVDANAVGLKPGEKKTFELQSAPKSVKVWLDVYLQPARIDGVHCTPAPTEQQMAERYAATAGTLTIELGRDSVVTATIEGARFELDGRPAIEVGLRRLERVRVRSLPG